MRKILIFGILFFCSFSFTFAKTTSLEQKIYSFLEKKTEDKYEQLKLIELIASKAKEFNNKDINKSLASIVKLLRVEIIKEESIVHEILLGITDSGKEIKAYYRGNPNKDFVLYVGNIHGGYEYGTYDTMLLLKDKLIRSGKKGWMLIETLNPDGLQVYLDSDKSEKYYLEGRSNINGIDLNRNFCTKSFNEFEYKKEHLDLSTGEICGQEKEIQAIENLFKDFNFSSLIDIHSAGGIIYLPENSFDDENVIAFANKVDEILELRYYLKTDYKDEKEKELLIKEYEIDSGGEGEFTGTLITYFYETTGKPAVLVELWDHGRIEDTILNLYKLLD